MDRRRFVAMIGAALAAPYARAQTAQLPRVVWLSVISRTAGEAFFRPFVEGMTARGHVDGRNVVIEGRWGEGSREVLDRLALEAVALKPAVLVTQGPAVHAARKAAGATTPVVFGFSGDPVELGVAKSLGRPGGNFTGVTLLAYDLVGKRVEMLREMLPKLKRVAVLSNPHHVGDSKELAATREAAARFDMEVSHHPAQNAADVERALAGVAAARAEAVVVHPDGMMVQARDLLGRFSIQHRVPMISGWSSIADGGTIATYGPSMQDTYRRLAYFADRILRGVSPADLPIENPSKLELVVNLKTARAIGLAIPQSILIRADRVIE